MCWWDIYRQIWTNLPLRGTGIWTVPWWQTPAQTLYSYTNLSYTLINLSHQWYLVSASSRLTTIILGFSYRNDAMLSSIWRKPSHGCPGGTSPKPSRTILSDTLRSAAGSRSSRIACIVSGSANDKMKYTWDLLWFRPCRKLCNNWLLKIVDLEGGTLSKWTVEISNGVLAINCVLVV